MLLDSNIIIYSAQPEYANLRGLIAENSPAVSALSYLEVLGYHQLTEQQRQYFEAFFQVAEVLKKPGFSIHSLGVGCVRGGANLIT